MKTAVLEEKLAVTERVKNLHRKCEISVQQCGGRFHGERPVSPGNKHRGNSLVATLVTYARQPQP